MKSSTQSRYPCNTSKEQSRLGSTVELFGLSEQRQHFETMSQHGIRIGTEPVIQNR